MYVTPICGPLNYITPNHLLTKSLPALRLHSVIPVNARWCNKDTILPRGGGADGSSPILVQKGTQVNMALYQMHRDSAYYGDDAHEFKPERWEILKPGWSFIPFSGGPRLCVGRKCHSFFHFRALLLSLLKSFQERKYSESKGKNYQPFFTHRTTRPNRSNVHNVADFANLRIHSRGGRRTLEGEPVHYPE